MSDTDRLEELARLPTVTTTDVGPDGEVALYYDVTGRTELYTLSPGTGELTQVSDGNVPRTVNAPIEWDTDGEGVFIHVDDDGDEQHDIYRLALDGTREPVIEREGQMYLQCVADGTLVVASTHAGQMNLFGYDRETEELSRLTDSDRMVVAAELSPDETRLAYAANESDDFDNMDVFLADADGSNARNLQLGETGAEAAPVDWGPDGDRLLVGDSTPDVDRVGVYDTRADAVTWDGDGDYLEEPVGFLPDGDRFVAQRVDGARRVPVIYDTETGVATETAFAGVAGLTPDPLPDGRLLARYQTATERETLAAYDPATGERETLLAPEYGDLDPSAFVDAERFTVTSNGVADTPAAAVETEPAEGLDIEALLYEPDEASTLIVNPHGGPPSADKFSFEPFVQYLVGEGYAVLQVNYRGSTGRGQAFRELLHDDWGGAEQADVARAVEHVVETRAIDDVAVYGGSYGGYSALWQLLQYPSLYDAGVAAVAVTDLFDMYENCMPHFRTELMQRYLGTPEENERLYEERSPVTHVENLDAPTLLMHGVNDPRVPVSQARIFRDALLDAGYERGEDGDFEYVEFGEEGHGTTDVEQKLRTFRTLDDFLSRRLGPEPVAADD